MMKLILLWGQVFESKHKIDWNNFRSKQHNEIDTQKQRIINQRLCQQFANLKIRK